MDGRTLCCCNNNISLYYAKIADKKMIFDMSREEQEIYDSMFYGENNPYTWEEYAEKENEFYSGEKSKNNYLLIEYTGEIIGTVSYSYNQAEIENMELDIYLRSDKHTGKGIGTQTLILLTDYLSNEYLIKTFIIRPSKTNGRAIRCYEKSGFAILNNFDACKYYVGLDISDWGNGDYGIDGTLNMIKTYP